MAETKKPTGLTVSRKGNYVTLKWKIGDKDYGKGQELKYCFAKVGQKKANRTWHTVDLGGSTTSKTLYIPLDKLYPTDGKGKLEKVIFHIRGKRKPYTKDHKTVTPTWSDWATKGYEVNVPNRSSLSATLSDSLTNVTTFAWSTSTSDTNSCHYRNVEWQSILLAKCEQTDGTKYASYFKSTTRGWQTQIVGASGSKEITEDTTLLAGGSYTRWFRVRSRGVAGPSVWRYARHVYARPNQAKIKSATATETETGGFQCRVTWEASAPVSQPIDSTVVQYVIVTPEEGMTCPDGASWNDANTSRDTKGNDSATFSIDGQLALDQCLFIRVNTTHDRNTTYGLPYLAATGYLSDSSNISVETNDSTHRATITATNNSAVTDSFLAVTYIDSTDPDKSFVVGIIEHGETSVQVQCPDWTGQSAVAFGVRAVVGTHSSFERADGADSYGVIEKMRSKNMVRRGGAVPTPPTNVAATSTAIPGTVRVTWDWSWADAVAAELSWADHEDAWESTDEPSTYEISTLRAGAWNISGLETGQTWYIRVRLVSGNGDNKTYGPYSEPIIIDLASAPSIPTLYLSEGVITEDGSVTASWAYMTTDGTAQAYAEICEATISASGIEYGEAIAHTLTAQHITIDAKEAGWIAGNTYSLCVRVVSASGKTSDSWSDPVSVAVADPLVAQITQTSFVEQTIIDQQADPEQGIEEVSRTINALTMMPLTVSVTGAGASGTTMITIERDESYHVERPDESMYTGHEGETIAILRNSGEGTVTIEQDDLVGLLDDGAKYRIIATVQDDLGQSAEDIVEFEVHWEHQAVMPEASVVSDSTDLIAKITPVIPEGAEEGDTCDIYRLSADLPELIVKGATFGTTYVDPYPAIGERGGHRVVFITSNGDYITEEQQMAWIDIGEEEGDHLDLDYSIIDFDGVRIPIRYNMDFENSWSKDFQETKYLGGAIQGDWNPAVSRTGSINAVCETDNSEEISAIRRLAVHAGICHVRTIDGSSYAADVQVKDSWSYENAGRMVNFSLSITRVDPEGFEGMTLTQWEV